MHKLLYLLKKKINKSVLMTIIEFEKRFLILPEIAISSFFLSSGSHFNPPFTLAVYLCGQIRLNMVVPYLVSQLLGGLLGAAMAKVRSPPMLLGPLNDLCSTP